MMVMTKYYPHPTPKVKGSNPFSPVGLLISFETPIRKAIFRIGVLPNKFNFKYRVNIVNDTITILKGVNRIYKIRSIRYYTTQ